MPYQNVYEPRPARAEKPLTDGEQKKLESELATLRDQQNIRANPPPPPPPMPKAAPWRKQALDKNAAKTTSAKTAVPAKKELAAPLKLTN